MHFPFCSMPVKTVSSLDCNLCDSPTRCSTRDMTDGTGSEDLEDNLTTGLLPVLYILGTFTHTGEDGTCCCCTEVTLQGSLRDKSASCSLSSDWSSGRCTCDEVLTSNLVFRPPAYWPLNLTICVSRKSNHCIIHCFHHLTWTLSVYQI